MIELTKIANILEEQLNDIAPIGTVAFDLRTNTGSVLSKDETTLKCPKKEMQPTKIDGVMTALSSEITPLSNLDNYTVSTSVIFAVPTPMGGIEDNSIAMLVYNIIVEYIERKNGIAYDIDFKSTNEIGDTDIESYSVVPIFQMPQVSEILKIPGQGFGHNISFYIDYSFIKNGVLSNKTHFSVDDEELVVIAAGIARTNEYCQENGHKKYR